MDVFFNILWEIFYALIGVGVGYLVKLIRDVVEGRALNDDFYDVMEDIGEELEDDFLGDDDDDNENDPEPIRQGFTVRYKDKKGRPDLPEDD